MLVRRVPICEMERAVRSGCMRVGATNDPLRRSSEYDRDGYSRCCMLVCPARNARVAENHLLTVAFAHGGGYRNVQMSSNYPNCQGFVYVILAPRRPRLFGFF